MLIGDINAVSSQNYVKIIHPLCGENTKISMLKNHIGTLQSLLCFEVFEAVYKCYNNSRKGCTAITINFLVFSVLVIICYKIILLVANWQLK
jgi:hypothetical protein